MRIFFIILVWLTEVFAFKRWFSCWLFSENFYLTPKVLTAKTIEAINQDRGVPRVLTHVLHNKATYFFWLLMQTLLQYWDVRFLKDFIGIVGAIGVGFAVWYFIIEHRQNKPLWVIFGAIILFAIVEMFFQPNILFAWKIIVFGGLFQILSLYGFWQFLDSLKLSRYILVSILLILSLLTVVFSPFSFFAFCLKI